MIDVSTPAATALSALRVSHCLAWLVPFYVLAVASLFLLRGRDATSIRSNIVIYTGGFMLALYFCNMWFFLKSELGVSEYRLRGLEDVLILGPGSLAETPRVVWIIACVSVATMGHALIYMVALLLGMEMSGRNILAVIFITLFVLTSLTGLGVSVTFWHEVYRTSGPLVISQCRQADEDTNEFLDSWMYEHPERWEPHLLRANVLNDRGLLAESRLLYEEALKRMDAQTMEFIGTDLERHMEKWSRAASSPPAP